ncbi:MAG: Zn-ribbon domain-containing OB-fold protein [Syntrophomonadaceae bacterium]
MENVKKQVPIKEGIFEYTGKGNEIQLVGSECPTCGEKFFPQRNICPKCSTRGLNRVFLSRTGTIKTFTVVRTPNPLWKGELPYIIVVVLLDGGGKCSTHLTGCDPNNVPIGARVECIAQKIYENQEGDEVIAHMFKLIEG